MRKTVDVDEQLLEEVMLTTGARTKKKAIELALQELLRAKRREELASLVGHYDDFSLDLEELGKMRRET